ncbi:MAG: replicative DNA helicase [Anaerolineae bacterium]
MAEAPYSLEAEEAVLGGIFTHAAALVLVADFLKAEDFFFIKHGQIWQAINRVADRGEAVDIVSVGNELKAMGALASVGGMPYLMQLINRTPTSAHVEIHGRIVERAAIRRRLLDAGDEIKMLARDEQKSLPEVLGDIEAVISRITSGTHEREQPFTQVVDEFADEIEALWSEGRVTLGISTGLSDLDAITSGLNKTDLLYIGGRPGMGKTALMLQWVVTAARLGYRMGIWTGEMGSRQLLQRMVSQAIGVSAQALRSGQLSQEARRRYIRAMSELRELPIVINDTPGITVDQLRAVARRWQRIGGLDGLMVDYVQLMGAPAHLVRTNNTHMQLTYTSQRLKWLAKELNIPVFVGSQLSRELEKRADKRPTLGDLRESGSLEADADLVIFVYREAVYQPETEFPNQAELIVAKQRNGQTGTAFVYFDKTSTLFVNGRYRTVDLADDREHED